jgi:polar amino acid transport system substrate-binding protein
MGIAADCPTSIKFLDPFPLLDIISVASQLAHLKDEGGTTVDTIKLSSRSSNIRTVLAVSALVILASALPATLAAAASCDEVKAKHANLATKAIKIGISPFSPGYEVADPTDPSHIIGFDADMVQALAACIGVKYTFESMDFSGLVGALEAKRIDLIYSSMYATPERAKKVNFVLYQKASTGSVIRKGNPKGITSKDTLCGVTAAVVTGTVEAETITKWGEACKSAGKPNVELTLFKDNDACVREVQVGRADFFMTDAGLAAALAKQFADTLDKGFTVASEYRFGVGANKDDTALLNAVSDGMKAIQDNGTETQLLTKWGFDPGQMEPARIVTQ